MEEDIYLVVKSIDLLTKEEAEKLPENIRNIDNWWWLQSPGFKPGFAGRVYKDGFVSKYGFFVNNDNGAICPALLIENLDSLNLPLYTEIEIFDGDWIYIGNNKALSRGYLWKGRFDEASNDYETSEIKQKLDTWLEEQKAEYDDD